MIKRRSFLRRAAKSAKRTPIKRSSKKIPTVNKAAKQRKLAKYRKFIQSPEWGAIRLDALKRAGYQCEASFGSGRCPMNTTLQVHHLSYSRFGGRELPKDLKVLCEAHHQEAHALKGIPMLWQRAG